MKKNGPKIIQISGLKGIALVAFCVVCLGEGFVVFPAKMAMHLWNYLAAEFSVPAIGLWQGMLLWAFIAMSIYMLNTKTSAISIKQPMELNDEELRILMDRIKLQKQAQKLNTMILKAEDIKIIKNPENKPNNVDESSKSKELSNNINEKHS